MQRIGDISKTACMNTIMKININNVAIALAGSAYTKVRACSFMHQLI